MIGSNSTIALKYVGLRASPKKYCLSTVDSSECFGLGVVLVLPLERSASLPGLDQVPGKVQREEVHLHRHQDESVPQQSVRVTLPDEDVRVLQLGALLQANVLQHVVQVVHDAVNQRTPM